MCEELIRDLCSVEFRTKSKTKELINAHTKKVREETIREVEEMLPKEEIIVSNVVDYQVEYLRGRNEMLEEVREILNKIKQY